MLRVVPERMVEWDSSSSGVGVISRVRIIAGRWRGRRIQVPDGRDLRPTLDQTRETLFNWLAAEVIDARCLDLFAGSGALGFEAASRGAASVTFVEQAARAIATLNASADQLGAADCVQIRRGDAFRWLAQPGQVFDLIFLDPPWRLQALPRLLDEILAAERLAPGGLVYFEAQRSDPFAPGADWNLRREKQAGESRYGLLERAT